jgi:pyruvate dehydrogenase E2 component (dihydrolipoamide acetyltransferase)
MATTVILPKQGQSVETCIITEWYKKKGDKVEQGDLLFAYETDKASFEEEAPAGGTLLEVFHEAGDEVAVLTEVALIGEPGEEIPRSGEPATAHEDVGEDKNIAAQQELDLAPEAAPRRQSQPPEDAKIRISPRARRLAEDKGVAVDSLKGSGPGGRIIFRDVEAAAQTAAASAVAGTSTPAGAVEPVTGKAGEPETPEAAAKEIAAPGVPEPVPRVQASGTGPSGDSEVRPLSNIRKLISGAMHASLQNSAQLTHHLSADARQILSLRSKVKKMQEEGYAYNITLNDMVSYAVIRALKSHPDANVHFLGESIRYFRKVHLGMAVDTERGLMVPVLRNADDLSLPGISEQLRSLADACRSGKIDPDLLQPEAATFTISNLGNYGVEMFTPVINLPQAGILGVNTILERPARMEDGTFGFIPCIGLSLTYDHRAIDGGPATLFLAEIKKEIEKFDHDTIKR